MRMQYVRRTTSSLGFAAASHLLACVFCLITSHGYTAEPENPPALEAIRDDADLARRYVGKRFTLESGADERLTRRFAAELERDMDVFAVLLPPRVKAERPIRIELFGSAAAYRRRLEESHIAIVTPACFIAGKNVILAGSELDRVAEEYASISAKHDALRDELKDMESRSRRGAVNRDSEAKASGDRRESSQVVQTQRRATQKIIESKRREIARVERENEAKITESLGDLQRRLRHELFHAYVENFAYPSSQYAMPVWMQEGMAKSVETADWKNDGVNPPRFGRMSPADRERLRRDLGGANPLSLTELLTAKSDKFHADENSMADEAGRFYVYAAGLVSYLAEKSDALTPEKLVTFLSPSEEKRSKVERFERLVGEGLPAFERRWREAMIANETK